MEFGWVRLILDTQPDHGRTSHSSRAHTRQMDGRVRGEINRSSGGETGLNTQIHRPTVHPPAIYLSICHSWADHAGLDIPRGVGWGRKGRGCVGPRGGREGALGHWSSRGVGGWHEGTLDNRRLIRGVSGVTWPSWTPADNTLTIATGWHLGHIILLYGTGRLPIFCCRTCPWFIARVTLSLEPTMLLCFR